MKTTIFSESFENKKIKDLFENIEERNLTGNKNYLSLVKDVGVIRYEDRDNSGNKTSDNPSNYKMVKKGDIVVNPMNITIGSVGLSKYDGCLSGVYLVLRPKQNINRKFYGYLFSYKVFQKYLNTISNGIMDIRETIDKTQFFQMKVPNPPEITQQNIVNYLDSKISLVDSLISKTDEKIIKLKKLKTSIINEAVTKGIEKSNKLITTDIEFLNKIPSDWKIRKLGYLGKFSKGKGITKADIISNGKSCIRNGEIYTSYDLFFEKCHSSLDEKKHKNLVYASKNTFLFTGDGETVEEIGKTLLYIGNEKIVVGGGIIIFKLNHKEINPLFLAYSLSSEYISIQKKRDARGDIIVHIYEDQLKNLKIAIPKLSDQNQIVEYLDSKINYIDSLISLENKRINLYKELRSSYISDIFDGSIKI